MNTPTKSELEILKVLWRLKQGTVRQVNEEINVHKNQGYTTTLKLIQIMEKKGFLEVDTKNKAHSFTPKLKEIKIKRNMVKNLLKNLFNNSIDDMLVQAISSKTISKKEINNLKTIIKNAESKLDK